MRLAHDSPRAPAHIANSPLLAALPGRSLLPVPARGPATLLSSPCAQASSTLSLPSVPYAWHRGDGRGRTTLVSRRQGRWGHWHACAAPGGGAQRLELHHHVHADADSPSQRRRTAWCVGARRKEHHLVVLRQDATNHLHAALSSVTVPSSCATCPARPPTPAGQLPTHLRKPSEMRKRLLILHRHRDTNGKLGPRVVTEERRGGCLHIEGPDEVAVEGRLVAVVLGA